METMLVPTIKPDGPKVTGVPETVIPGPPDETTVPATEKTAGFDGLFSPSSAGAGGVLLAGIAIVLEPITRPDGPRETGVFETVMAGAPWERIVPATERAVGLAVKVWLPIVTSGTGVFAAG